MLLLAQVHCSSSSFGLSVENAEGGNFITCPLTFVADANCAKYVGAEVKFVDINLDTWNISIESIKETVDSKTKAVVVTHFAGLPAMINEIEEFCKNEGIFLIEDVCHSPGATLNEKNTEHLVMRLFFHYTQPNILLLEREV